MSDDVTALLSGDKGSNRDTLPLSAATAAAADVPWLKKQKKKQNIYSEEENKA